MILRFLDRNQNPASVDVPASELLKTLRNFKRQMVGAERINVSEFLIWLDSMPGGWQPDEVNQQQFYKVEEIETILNLEKAARRSKKAAKRQPILRSRSLDSRQPTLAL
jgi:ribosomal protein S21